MKIRSTNLVLALLVLACVADAQNTYTWTGTAPAPSHQEWSNPQNWSPSDQGVPGPNDTAIIGGDKTVNLDSAVTVDTVTLGNGSTMSGAGSLTINGTFTCLAATLSPSGGVTVTGSINIQPAAPTVTISAVTSTLTINGNCTVNANAALWFGPNASVVNNGTFTVADTASLTMPSVSGATFINNGQFMGGNATCSTSSSLFSNTAAGAVQITAGANFQFMGNFANSGSMNVGAGGQASVSAAAALHGGSSFLGSGVTVLSGNNALDGTVTVPGNLQMTSSALMLNGTLEVPANGNFTWLGGTLTGVGTNVTGAIQVDAAGTMLMNNVNGQTLKNCNVNNNGMLVWTNGGTTFMGYNASILNGKTFLIYNDGSLQPINGAASAAIYNAGFTSKVSGATNSATLINVPFHDTAQVQAWAGNLKFGGGGDIGEWGAFRQAGFTVTNISGPPVLTPTVGPPVTIQLANGNYNSTAGRFLGYNYFSSITGGNIIMSQGVNLTIPVGGNLAIASGGSFQQVGGTISGNGRIGINGSCSFTWSGGAIALTNPVAIQIAPGGTLNLSGENRGVTLLGSGVQNKGTLNWVNDNDGGGASFGDSTFIDNFGAFNIQCSAYLNNSASTVYPALTNEATGTITKSASTGYSYIGFPTVNAGTITVQSGTLDFHGFDDTGLPDLDTGLPSTVLLQGGNVTFDNSTTIYGTIQGSGNITVQSGGGTFNVEDTLLANQLSLTTATTVNDGTIKAGDAPGLVSLSNNYTQTTNGILIIPIRGTNIANLDFGRIFGWGFATLAGTLVAQVTEGYAPPVGATFPFLVNFYERVGTFDHVILPPGMTINYTSSGATLVVTGTVPVQIISPTVANGQFQFGFNTISNRSYAVQSCDNLSTGTWSFLTNFVGDGTYWQPPLLPLVSQRYYRVSNP